MQIQQEENKAAEQEGEEDQDSLNMISDESSVNDSGDDAAELPEEPVVPTFSLGALATDGSRKAAKAAPKKKSKGGGKGPDKSDLDAVHEIGAEGEIASKEVLEAIENDTLLRQVVKALSGEAPSSLLGLLTSRAFADASKVGYKLKGESWTWTV